MAFSNQDTVTNIRINLQNGFNKLNKTIQAFLPRYAPSQNFVGGLAEEAVVGARQAAKKVLNPQPVKQISSLNSVKSSNYINPQPKLMTPSATLSVPSFQEPKRYSVGIPEFKMVGGRVLQTLKKDYLESPFRKNIMEPFGRAIEKTDFGQALTQLEKGEDIKDPLALLPFNVAGVTKVKTAAQALNPTNKLVNLIREAKVMRPEQETLYSTERAIRSAKVANIGKKIPGEAGFQAQLGALKGELPKIQFERIRQNFSQLEIDDLFNQVEKFDEFLPFEKITTKNALAKLLDKRGGGIPTEREIELLSKIFPDDLIKAIRSKEPFTQKLLHGLGEVFNIPRSLMASFDLSAPLRQGVFLVGRPKQWVPAFKDMFKFALSENAYDDLSKQIAKRPTYALMKQHNLALTDLKSLVLTGREEAFMSSLPEKIPGIGKLVRASNRAYTGFLNKLRADTFDDIIKSSNAAGVPQTAKLYDDISTFVNAATGRGDFRGLLKPLEKGQPLFNATLFSPRLLASRLSLLDPTFYAGLHPQVRKEALKSLISFATAGLSVLGLAKLAGAEVGADPRSSDFGKIKIGNTRYDPWGGFQQYVKLASQLITGELVSSTTGKVMTLGEGYKPLSRKDIFLRFFESKESPIASFVTSLLNQQTPTGEPVNAKEEVVERAIPMFIQDLYELYQEGQLNMISWLPGLFGVGSQTYGKQELVKGQNLLGEDTMEVRPVQSLGKSIVEKVFGKQTLQPSRTYGVSEYVKELDKMPKQEAAKIFKEINQTNPDLADKIRTVKKEQVLGITPQDQVLKGKGVASGERTLAIFKELNKLKDDKERATLWNEYRKKGIITDDVADQLKRLIKQQRNEKQTNNKIESLKKLGFSERNAARLANSNSTLG